MDVAPCVGIDPTCRVHDNFQGARVPLLVPRIPGLSGACDCGNYLAGSLHKSGRAINGGEQAKLATDWSCFEVAHSDIACDS